MSEYRPILSERTEDILKAIEWGREEQRKILFTIPRGSGASGDMLFFV